MRWLISFLTSTIGRKIVVALTGLFICLFLVVHLAGNLQLIFGDAEQFNEYTYTMTHNKVIKIVSYVTYASILLHAFVAIAVAAKNRTARPTRYAVRKQGTSSSWSSRNMAFLGVVLLAYIVMHLGNFWWVLKFGEIDTMYTASHPQGVKDIHAVVMEAFRQPWLVGLYVIAMIALSFHLVHGFGSGFQTVGVNHAKYTPIIRATGVWVFGILLPLGFAAIPVYIYLAGL